MTPVAIILIGSAAANAGSVAGGNLAVPRRRTLARGLSSSDRAHGQMTGSQAYHPYNTYCIWTKLNERDDSMVWLVSSLDTWRPLTRVVAQRNVCGCETACISEGGLSVPAQSLEVDGLASAYDGRPTVFQYGMATADLFEIRPKAQSSNIAFTTSSKR